MIWYIILGLALGNMYLVYRSHKNLRNIEHVREYVIALTERHNYLVGSTKHNFEELFKLLR